MGALLRQRERPDSMVKVVGLTEVPFQDGLLFDCDQVVSMGLEPVAKREDRQQPSNSQVTATHLPNAPYRFAFQKISSHWRQPAACRFGFHRPDFVGHLAA